MSTLFVSIRQEGPADQQPIRLLNVAAFGGLDEARIVDEIRGTADWLDGGSLVAVDESGALVGHVLLSRGRLMGDGAEWAIGMIGPVAVAPESQRRGVGSALVRAAIERAEELGLPVLCLLGHVDYYPRFGFRPARSIGIEPPRPWSDESWLALALSTWVPEMRGLASYPEPFGVG